MKNSKRNKLIERIFLYLVVVSTAVLLFSCKSKTLVVPLESVKTEYRDRWLRDSIRVVDSVFVDRWTSGDTVFVNKQKFEFLYRDRLVRDSVFIRDTLRVPYPVVETKVVKPPYNWYEKLLLALGLVCIGMIGFRVYKFIK